MKNFNYQTQNGSVISSGNLYSQNSQAYSSDVISQVVDALMSIQNKFFSSGLLKDISTMKLQNVADLICKDISTVSKILKDKYILINGKVFLIKNLYNTGGVKKDDIEDVSKFTLVEEIKNIIEHEDPDKPYGDRIISEMMKIKGYKIERETVKKYRTIYLGLPASTKGKGRTYLVRFKLND